MVTETGMVKHKIIEMSVPKARLTELHHVLNQRLRNINLVEAKQRIVQEIKRIESARKKIFSFCSRGYSREMFDFEEEVYLDKPGKRAYVPEFHDYEPMRSILKLSEDKGILTHLLEKDINREGVRVVIGSESSCEELKNLSVISSVYKNGDNPVGMLGIIGPKRMEYPKMMAIVNAVSKMLNKILTGKK